MASDRDDETGRFSEQYSDEAFLEAVSELDPATTAKVANYVGCSYDLAYRRLLRLSKGGRMIKQEVGGSFVWDVST